MSKPWLAQYPEGVPAEIDTAAHSSLNELFERDCSRFAELPAYSNMGVALSYRSLEHTTRAFAAYLQRELGLERGARVALMMPNLMQYPVALHGVLRAGLTVVNVNPLYTARELEHQLRDSGATAIVVLENFAHTLEQVLDKTVVKHVITTQVGDLLPKLKSVLVNLAVKHIKHLVPAWHIPSAVSFLDALRSGESHTLSSVSLTQDDIAFLQYTGGTTGVAKGVVLSHGNMIANVQQVGAWIAPKMRFGEDVAVVPLPLYHIYALTSCLVFGTFGAHRVLITNPRDMPTFIDTLKHIKMNAIIGVNTLYNALCDAPGFAEVDTSQLRVCAAGGMAVQRAVAEKWKRATGSPLVEGYGLSETSPVVISNRLDIQDWTGMLGLPLPSTDAAILADDGTPMPPGEVGEICVRGPQVMKGYWNKPEETKEVFTPNGWMRTGDMGLMDDKGQFKITDRKKDMIVVSGFKIFPNEVEDVVMMHPGVLEVGVIGVPDDKSGESVKAVVVKKDPQLTEEALLEHCRKLLTAYKVPKRIAFSDTPLPKSPIGKILRKELRRPTDGRATAA